MTGSDAETRALRQVAELMCLAARTAPKAKGVDNLTTMVLEGEEKDQLTTQMRAIAKETELEFFERDAGNIDSAQVVVLLGTRVEPVDVPACGYCGFKNCDENRANNGICAYNTGDLGIAVGSAAAVAARHHADNRIMFTAGKAALRLELLGPDVRIAYGIPLSGAGKNPFFDRD